jgi:branched-chain amino acid transport system substrate-binding protein
MKIKSMIKKLTVSIMAATFLLSGCGSSETASSEIASSSTPSQEPIKVGTSFPLTGSVAADGKMILNAIEFAAEQVNADGGIQGRDIEIVSEDDEADPTTAASVANKFAEDDSILSVITSYNSSCGLAQIPVYKEAGLSAISPVTTSPDITGMSDYYYRTCNNDGIVGKQCAEMLKALGCTKIAVLYEVDDYGYGIYSQYSEKALELGLEEATVQTFVYGETKDFSTIVTAVKNSGADGIFFAGLATEMGLFSNQASTQGISFHEIPCVAPDGCNSPATVDAGGDDVNGLYTLGPFSLESEDPEVQTFISNYFEKYNEEPSGWSALAYDAAMTLFEAMKSCDNLDRESINTALQNISYEGVTGLNEFNDSDVTKTYLTFQIQDGEIKLVEIQ